MTDLSQDGAQLSEEQRNLETEKGRRWISGQLSDKEVGHFYQHHKHNHKTIVMIISA